MADGSVQDLSQTLHTQGAEHSATVDVAGLNDGDNVVLRFELDINCNGQTPTGNLQASLETAQVIAGGTGAIGSGAQTIPLKRVGDIVVCKAEAAQRIAGREASVRRGPTAKVSRVAVLGRPSGVSAVQADLPVEQADPV